MAGIYKGVQARILEKCPKATFVPCAGHSLNLVGHHAAAKVLPAKLLLGQIQSIFTFFSASPQRWSFLTKHCKKHLNSQSNTRWSSKADAVAVLSDEYENIYETLIEIMNSDNVNPQTLAESSSQLNQIYNFKFVLGMTVWNFVLSRIQIVSVALQKENIALDVASKHLEGLLNWIESFKINGYEQSLEKAKLQAEAVGLDLTSGLNHRVSRGKVRKRFLDNPDSNLTNKNNLDKFKSEFFDAVLSTLIHEFKGRFRANKEAFLTFSLLWGNTLHTNDLDALSKSVIFLSEKYNEDLDPTVFLKEVQYLKSAVEPFLNDEKSIADTPAIDALNVLTQNGLHEQFLNCHTALRLFLTIPVTVASNERAFSKLKIIKSFLRSSMGQERLSGLGILSIEHEYVDKMQFDSIINDFIAVKCRKVVI